MTSLTAPAEPIVAPAAELDRRFYAYAIDHAIAWGIDAAAIVVVYRVLIEPGRIWAGVAAALGVVLLVGAVFAVALGVTGSSPGRAVAGIRVVRAGTDHPLGVRPALLRGLIVGAAGWPTLGLGVATLAWTAAMDPRGRRRGWHDTVAGSEVVDARPVEAEASEPSPAPRHIVNLTALRLVPAPAPRPGVPPPPTRPPSVVRPPVVAPVPETVPEPVPEPEPVLAAPRASAARQQLGFPLVPEPRPEPLRGGAHAARVEQPPVTAQWRIRFDTGEAVVVDGLVLVGRRPESRNGEEVRHLVALPSADMSLSKTHAQVDVAPDGALVVMDRGSTNGSFLVRHGVPRGLSAGKPATLVDGDRVRFGDREMTVVQGA